MQRDKKKMKELTLKEILAHVALGISLKVGKKFFLMLFRMILNERKKQLFSIFISTDLQWGSI